MSVAVTTQSGAVAYLHRPHGEHVARVIEQITAGTYPAAAVPEARADAWKADNAPWILGRWLPGRYMNTVNTYDIRAGAWTARPTTRGRDVLTDLRARNEPALRLLVESYLATVAMPDGRIVAYEVACCNGSTGVPDIMRPCGLRVKDPASMPHDYIYDLNHGGEPVDTFGGMWTRESADDAYCDILRAADMPFAAIRRAFGLQLYSAGYWARGVSRGGMAASR